MLGNISIGCSSKIGAGSVLLRDIPSHATAVGVPAKIIGRTNESDPGEEVDTLLRRVSLFGRKPSTITTAASTASNLSSMEEVSSIGSGSDHVAHNGDEPKDVTKTPGKVEKLGDGSEWTVPPKITSGDEFCPFREYSELAARGTPKGTVNILHLADLLQAEGVPQCDLGLSFYDMDESGRGYVKLKKFLEDGPGVLCRVCGFSPEKASAIVQSAAALVEAA